MNSRVIVKPAVWVRSFLFENISLSVSRDGYHHSGNVNDWNDKLGNIKTPKQIGYLFCGRENHVE